MKKIGICLTSLLLLLTMIACQQDDLGPLVDHSHDSVAQPDTVVPPDFRTAFTGLFDVTEIHAEFLSDTTTTYFTDSVKFAYDSSLAMPISIGGYHLMTLAPSGDLTQDYEHEGPPWPAAWSGHFNGTNEFTLYVDMDIQPHTWHSVYHGVRH